MNIICEDCRNAKIIEILQLGKAVLTLKFNIFTTVGSMLYRLTLTLAYSEVKLRLDETVLRMISTNGV